MKYSLILIFLLSSLCMQGQGKAKTFEAKKGEVLDFLFLNTKSDTDSIQTQYFKTAFPVANKYGYTPLGGIAVKETPLQGNYHPEVVALGKWPSKTDREVALTALETEVVGFHQMRREIWSTFNVVHFELAEDVTLQIAPNRYYVVTNLWKSKSTIDFNNYIDLWESKAQSLGGELEVSLTGGEAPYGYRYTPDYLSITSWESKAEFDEFLEASNKIVAESLQHIHQFRVQ